MIIGFAAFDSTNKRIYDYDAAGGRVSVMTVSNISPYLIEGSDTAVSSREKPLCGVPEIVYGSKPVDGGNLIFDSEDELKPFIKKYPDAEKFVRPFIGSIEFINGTSRWCLWLCSGPESRAQTSRRLRVE